MIGHIECKISTAYPKERSWWQWVLNKPKKYYYETTVAISGANALCPNDLVLIQRDKEVERFLVIQEEDYSFSGPVVFLKTIDRLNKPLGMAGSVTICLIATAMTEN